MSVEGGETRQGRLSRQEVRAPPAHTDARGRLETNPLTKNQGQGQKIPHEAGKGLDMLTVAATQEVRFLRSML